MESKEKIFEKLQILKFENCIDFTFISRIVYLINKVYLILALKNALIKLKLLIKIHWCLFAANLKVHL